jgi:hypothetical protein
VKTDRTIPNYKLDIIICDNGKGTCLLTDTAFSGDRNVIKKEAEKIFKIGRPYNINTVCVEKTKVIPAIMGANGTISKSQNIRATNPENTTSRNYRKQLHRALCTYFGKY